MYYSFEYRNISANIVMDKLDFKIIDILQSDGRKPFTDIAKALDISEGTVRNRVSRLVEDRILHIVGLIDPSALGFNAPAMIGLTIQPPLIESVAESVASFEEVSYLIMVSGEFDLFVEVLCKDRDHLASFLNEKLLRVPGIVRTQTYITLRTYKMAYGAMPMIPNHKRLKKE